MSIAPEPLDDNAEWEADRQADAMKAQLRKDVNSWAKARSDASPGRIAEASPPVVSPPAPRPVARTKKAGAAAPAVKPADTRAKPFSMSYNGGSTKDYIQYMIDRGAR